MTAFARATGFLALFALFLPWISAPRASAQGDYYFRNRGPDVPIRKEDPPRRKQFCTEYDGSDERRDCFLGVDAGRRWAAQYGGMKGWEGGYLTGYAWALFVESRTYSEDPTLRRKGADSVAGMPEYQQAVEKERSEILETARKAGSEAATQLLDEAFERAAGIPDTTLAEEAIPIGSYEPGADPYQKYVGTDISRKAILKRDIGAKTVAPFRATSFELVVQSDAPEFDLLTLVFDDGIYKVDPSAVYDNAQAMDAWRHSKFAPAENANVNKRLEEKGFGDAYQLYVKYNYAKEYYRGLDMGTEKGLPLGKRLGERMAFLHQQRETFNKRFNEQMASVYQKAVAQGYRQGWEKAVADAKKPIIKLVDLEMYGEADDGVISPGEKIGFRCTVENRGLVAVPQGKVQLGGKGAKPLSATPVAVEAFKSAPLDTGLITQLNPRMRPRSKAKLIAAVAGVKIPVETEVHSVVEIADFRIESLELSQSKAAIVVGVKSLSTQPAPDVTVAVAMNGKLQTRVPLGTVEPGKSLQRKIELTTLDPMQFNPSKSALQIRIYQGKSALDGSALPMKVAEPTNEIVRYYDLLANGEGYVPEGTTREARLAAVEKRLLGFAAAEIRKNAGSLTNLWKLRPEKTIPGRLLRFRRAESEQAKQSYARLGEGLCALDESFTKVQYKKKKTYRELCERVRDGK